MKKKILIPILVFASLLTSATVIAAAVQTSLISPTLLRDGANGIVLSIQLAPGRSDTGRFDLTIPGTGTYEGTISLLQSGKQIVNPQGTTTAHFFPLSGGVPSTVSVRMEGQINSAQNKASVNVWVGNSRYLLQTVQPDTVAATTVAKQVLTSTVSKNWQSVYGLLSAQVQGTVTSSQFIQSMMSSANSTIIAAVLNGPGQVKTVGGYSYFIQPITITTQQSSGAISTLHSTQFFVLENGVWRLLSTTSPKP